MSSQETTAVSPDRRHHVALILMILGFFDLALGAVIAVFGPAFIGDPSLDTFIRIVGIVFAASGFVLWWFGRRQAARADATDDGSAVQRRA